MRQIECGAPPELVSLFAVMGGECNYLLEPRVDLPADGISPRVRLAVSEAAMCTHPVHSV